MSMVSMDRLIAINRYKCSITLYYKARSVANMLEIKQYKEIRRTISYK